jgi:non-homologous end joining protein Ku
MEKLIEAKAHGKKLAVVPHRVLEPAVDLMAALKKSIESKPNSKTLLKTVPEASKKRKAG